MSPFLSIDELLGLAVCTSSSIEKDEISPQFLYDTHSHF